MRSQLYSFQAKAPKDTQYSLTVSMYFIDITKLSCMYEMWHTISMHNWRWVGVCDQVKKQTKQKKTIKQNKKNNNSMPVLSAPCLLSPLVI